MEAIQFSWRQFSAHGGNLVLMALSCTVSSSQSAIGSIQFYQGFLVRIKLGHEAEIFVAL